MNLSKLQKYILLQSINSRQLRISRSVFEKFYEHEKNPPKDRIRANIITKSLERLIERGLMIGFGEKTQHKLFIRETKLTAKGKKAALSLLGRQSQFPFLTKKSKK